MKFSSRSLVVAGLVGVGLLTGAAITPAQTTSTPTKTQVQGSQSTVTTTATTPRPAAKVIVKHGPASTAATKKQAATAALKARPAFAPAPTVVNSVNFGNVNVGGSPVTMTVNFPIVSAGASSVVPSGGMAPGSSSDYIFFGNSNVEFNGPPGGQPSNLNNFTVNTLSNVEFGGNGNYTSLVAPGGFPTFTTGSLTDNPTNYPNTTPHTSLLATFSPNNAGSFTVYILDGNTDGVYVGNSSVGLGMNGGPAITTVSHVQSGGNEFTRYNISSAMPSDVFQVYATTSTNSYPTIGGLMFVTGAQAESLTPSTTANLDFTVANYNCNSHGCNAQVTFTPGYPGLRYDSLNLVDVTGNIVNQTYIYGVGMAPQFGYELGNLTEYDGYVEQPMSVALGPDESIYYTNTGLNVISKFARDFSSSSQITFSDLETPGGIVVDGSNTIYLADHTENLIYFQNAAQVQGVVTTSPLNGPSQLAIDGTGALYIADTGNNRVIKIDNQGNETTVASGLSSPTALALDSAGDVFIGDTGTGGEILEVTPGATAPIIFESNLGLTPVNLSVDAGGTVYLTSLEQGLNIYRSNSQNESFYATGNDIAFAVLVDRNGDIFQTNPQEGHFTITDRTASNFILNTPVGVVTTGGLTIANTGNMPLTITNLTTTGPQFVISPNQGTCALPQALNPATTCNVTVSFTPPEAQYYTDTMQATSNSLNVPGTLDPFYLAGSGLGAPSTIALSAAPTSVQAGNPVLLLVTVADTTMTYTPTGAVTFMDGSTVLGTMTLTPGTQPFTGMVQFTTSSLSPGSHSITAVYAGDLNVDNNTSSAVNVTVYSGTPPPNGGLLVSTQDLGQVAVGTLDQGNSIALDNGVFNATLEGNTDFNNLQLRCDLNCYGASFTFSPLFPGLRADVILEYDNNNNLIGKIYLTGTGTGPQFAFDPGATSVFSGSIAQPTAITYGQDGTLYVADQSTNKVYSSSVGSNSGATALGVVNLGTIGGIAVDASKVIYVTDQTHNLVVTYDQVTKQQASIPTDQLSSPAGVVVDGMGGLYVADVGNNRVIRIDNRGHETVVVSNVPATLGPIAIDGAGDLFYAVTASPGSVTEIPFGGGQPISIVNNIGDIHGLAVDAAGKVYYTNDSGATAIPLQNCGSCSLESIQPPAFQNEATFGLALDPAGDIFQTGPGAGQYIESIRNSGQSVVTGPVGSSTQGTPFLVSNTGNMPITISTQVFGNTTFFQVDPSSTCSNGTILGQQQTCSITPDFTPPQAQSYTDPLTFTSNSLNASGATNTYFLYGTGIPAAGGPGTTVLGVASNSIQLGQTVLLTATVTGITQANPTGTVNFYNGSTLLGSGPLAPLANSRTASASYGAYGGAVGTWSVTATYSGDANNPSSTSAAQTITITKASTVTSLSASSTNLSAGTDEVLTAKVAGLVTPVVSAVVNFFDGTTPVGYGAVLAGSNGNIATLDLGTTVPAGTHSYTAMYSGDSNYLTSTSQPVSVTVVSAIVSSQNFGSVALGSSVTMPVTIGGTGSITITNAAEFAPTSNPNCTTSCTISITFTPKYPGLRVAAASVSDSQGNILGRTFLYGVGTAPQFAYDPPYNQSTTSFSAQNAAGIAFGPDGTVFVSDSGTNTVTQYPPNGPSSIVPLGNIGQVGAIAVDASVTVYVVDQVNAVVVSSTVNNVVSKVKTSPLGGNGSSGPAAIAVDGTGALYIDDSFNERIIKIDNQGNETRLVSTNNSTNPSFPTTSTGMAVDAAGDVFYTDNDSTGGVIQELPVAGGGPITVVSGLSSTISALALDPAGRFYYLTSTGQQSVLNGQTPVNQPDGYFNTRIVLNLGSFTALAVNPSGAILAGDTYTGAIDIYDRKGASFNATAQVGSTSKVTFPVSNTGDTTLTLSGVGFVNGSGFGVDPSSACTVGSTIAPASVCLITVDFSPTTPGNFQSNLSVASNNLNAASSTNVFVFTGQGSGLIASTTTLAASTNTPTLGQTVTFTATVTDGSQTAPTGTVQFLDGNTVIGSGTLNSTATPGTAQAQFATSTLTAGSHTITAAYGGSSVDNGSTSGAQGITVSSPNAATTSITLATTAGTPTGYALPISLLATVITGQVTPVTVGQVIFCDASLPRCNLLSNLGTAQLNSSGVATLKIYPGSIGTHSYSAKFLGTTAFQPAATTSSPQVTVAGTYPSVTMLSSTGSVGNYSLTGTVAGIGAPSLAPTGPLSFVDNSNGNAVLGSANLGSSTLGFGEVQPVGSPLGVGSQPYGVAAADLNGDGFVDIVTENYGSASISVAFGLGDGTFLAPATYAVQSAPERVLIADFNGDGYLDLVVANTGSNTVSVLLNQGNGTFATQVPYPAASPVGLGVMDLNHDGTADIVASDYYANTVSVLLGNGDGTFKPAVTYPTGTTPQTLAEGDFNGDGTIDLAVGNFADGTVSIYLGTGDGTFRPQVTYAVGRQPQGVQVGDFNGDGIADLAVSNSTDGTVSILLGNGDGTFRSQVAYPVGGSPVGLVVADFNGDGKQDISVGNTAQASLTQGILLGNGDGTFQPQLTYPTGNFPYGVAAADFNGDGFPDMVVSNFNNNTATIFLTQITQSAAVTINGVALAGAPGQHTVQAVYAGDANFKTSTSAVISLTSAGSGPAAQTITFPAIPNHIFGDAPFTLSATASSGLTVSYTVTAGPATVSGNTVTLTGAGSVTIQATQAGNASYSAASPVSQSFTVAQSSQTINFPAIPNHLVSDPPFTVGATASSGLTVSFAVTSGPATVSGSTVTLTGAGTVIIQATQTGNTNYSAATPVSQSFTVATASQTITFPAIPNHLFGDPAFTLAATSSSQLPVTYAVTAGPATVSGNTVTLTGAGSVTIQATQAGNSTYAPATPVSQSFTVAAASQTINFPAIPNHLVTDPPFTLSATATSSLAVSYAVTSGPATVSGNTVTLTGAGTVVIQATQAGNTNYAAATPVSQSFTVASATQTITFPQIPNHIFGDLPFPLSATASSGLAVTYIVTSGPATVSGNTVTLTGAGAVTIQATQTGNTTYAAATPVSQSFQVAQASQTITFPAIPNHIVTDPPFTLVATASSGLAVTYTVTSGPATVSGNTVTLTGTGTVVIQATQTGNTNYTAASPVSQSVAVSLATQTITFPAIPNHMVTDPPFTLGATATSGLTVTYTVTSGPATISGNAVTLTGTGTVVVQASQAGNTTYAAATPVSQSFTVSLGTQTITFGTIPNHLFGDPPFPLSATASSGLAVTYAVTSGPATISGNTVTLTGAGTVTIQASQQGNTSTYSAATPVSQTFTVAQATQTITFAAIPNHLVTDPPFTVSATASSGLPVAFALVSGPATISGNTVTLTGAGAVLIQATQAGNTNYSAGTPVSQSFTVSLIAQTITFPAIPNHIVGDPAFAISAAASSKLPVTFAVTSGPATIAGNQVTVTGAGTVVITATQAGDTTYAAATPVSQSFTVALQTQTITFPAISTVTFGAAPFTVPATASSGLTVSFVVTSGPATVSGSTVTLTGPGTVVLQATQGGNTTFAAATPVTQSFLVLASPPTLAGITPAGGVVGSGATVITLTGANFIASDTVQLNGNTIATTFVSATSLTATVPATFLTTAGTGQITVADTQGRATAAQTFSVQAAPVINFTGPTTILSGSQPTVTFQLVNPYPFSIAGTLTLTNAPSGTNPVDDPAVQFSTGGRTIVFTIPALSQITPTVQIQSGTVTGVVTVTLVVTSNGVNVTPSNVAPVKITIPAAVPTITTSTVTRSGSSLTVTVEGFSNTRELTTAIFHFTPIAGSTVSTPDITAPVTTVFGSYFTSAASAAFGSTFLYTQNFTLSTDASSIQSVTVTLVNSQGNSIQAIAQ